MSHAGVSGLRIAAILVVGCLIALGGVSTVVAEDPSHDVAIETPDQIVEDDEQTIEITVTNNDDEDMTFPLVEVPLQDGLTVPEDDRSERAGDEDGFEGVTVELNDGTEDRLAFIDESSYRDAEAIFIEGEELTTDEESKTYAFNVTVDTSSEVEIEADVRPLNQEENNERDSKTVDPVGTATIDAAFEDADASVTVDGVTRDGDVETDVAGDETHEVSGDVSILPGQLTVEITPDANTLETVRFTDVESGEADDPVVVARTGSTAEVIEGTESTSFEPGTAEDNSTQEVEFDLTVSSGEAHIVVEDSEDVPLRGIEDEGDFSDAEFENGVARVVQDGEVDDLRAMDLTGYPLGDVTQSGSVDDEDATEIAAAVATGESLSEYGDVTKDGDISAVDAMKVKQYDEGDRDEEYEVIN